MGSNLIYSIPLIRAAEGAMPPKEIKEGGKYLLVITGDFAGATLDLHIQYEGHPAVVSILGIQQTAPTSRLQERVGALVTPPITFDNPVTELWLPAGTEVTAGLMGGSPIGVDITLILVG